MALVYVGSNIGSRAGSTSQGITLSLTSLTGGISSSAKAGDIVIAATASGSSANRALSITSSGYTTFSHIYVNGTVDTNLLVGYKVLTTAETSVACGPSLNTADALTFAAHVWRGVDKVTPLDVTQQSDTFVNFTRPTPPPITPVTTGAQIILVGAGANATTSNYSASGVSNFITTASADTYDSVIGMGSVAWTSGTYTPAQWTGGAADGGSYTSAAYTIALRPGPEVSGSNNFFQFF